MDPLLQPMRPGTVQLLASVIGPSSASQQALDKSREYANPAFFLDTTNGGIVVVDLTEEAKDGTPS